MYLPEQFKEPDTERALALVEANPFGMLVTTVDGEPFVSHLPFLIRREAGSLRLLAHMARTNPQWRHFAETREVLAVFQGPHAYISPNWYGVPRVIEDEVELEALLEAMTRMHEGKIAAPRQSDPSPEYKAKLLGMLVGFEIEVTDIQAKFKLSQNRPEEDRVRVATSLAASGDEASRGVAQLMRERGGTA